MSSGAYFAGVFDTTILFLCDILTTIVFNFPRFGGRSQARSLPFSAKKINPERNKLQIATVGL